MTKNINNVVRLVGDALRHLSYPIHTDGTGDVNQGDLVYLDGSNDAVPLDTDAHAAQYLGVAAKPSFEALYAKDGALSKVYEGSLEVAIGCVAFFKTTMGDTYNEGDALYIGADAQTVTNTAGGATHILGRVKLRDGSGPVVGGAGVTVDMLVIPIFPVASL